MAGEFQAWASKLRIRWMQGSKGRNIIGGIAAIFDLTTEYAMQSLLEHLPEFASLPANLLTASGLGLVVRDTIDNETLRGHLAKHIPFRELSGTMAGILWALDIIGYSDAVLVQQNGRAFRLASPSAFVPSGVTSESIPGRDDVVLFIYDLGVNPFFPAYLDGHAWFSHDLDFDWCSRFALIFDEPPDNWPTPANPPTTTSEPSIDEFRLIKRAVDSMRPAKAKFLSITVIQGGVLWDWPVMDWTERATYTWGEHTSITWLVDELP
jgi:hypothetical protein